MNPSGAFGFGEMQTKPTGYLLDSLKLLQDGVMFK